jgi:hypothetical protein
METFDPALIEEARAQLALRQRPEELILTGEELQEFINRGNSRPGLAPNFSDNHKVNLVDGEDRWIRFCAVLPGKPEWLDLLKSMSWENKGYADGFARYLMRHEKSRIKSLNTIRVYFRELSGVYHKYTGCVLDKRLRNYFLDVAQLEIVHKFGLRREPQRKNHIGPGAFVYLTYFSWARNLTRFKIGLDRVDDTLIRMIRMWSGCRTHELVFRRPPNNQKKIDRYNQNPGAYTTPDNGSDEYIRKRDKICWVCERRDERTDAALKVLCWEDIFLFRIKDPEGTGCDRFAMQILLRFHKGENKEIRPTLFPFIEEKLPMLCPIAHVYAKAKAQKAFANDAFYDTPAWFNTKLSKPAVRVEWKKEFLHKPVFCKTVETAEGPRKSDEPLTAASHDNNTTNLGKAAGLEDDLKGYDYRRGNLEVLDCKSHTRRLDKFLTIFKRSIEARFGIRVQDMNREATSIKRHIIMLG